MKAKKSTKDVAQRIDPVYYRRRHPLRRLRLLLSAGLVVAGGLWVAASFALPAEGIYVRGSLSRAHSPLKESCDRCHTDSFGSVRDATCLACHSVGSHVKADETIRDPRCGTCHAEHGGRVRLSDVADGFCNACHDRHRNITSMADHVEFERAPKDQHLRFSHLAHVAPTLLGGPLGCADCHRPQADARDFLPIRFEEHCAKCHRERLDPRIGRDVPHGVQPEKLSEWAAAAFVHAFLEGKGPGEPPSRPNATPRQAPEAPPDWTSALRARTDAAVEALLTPGRGCLLCHDGDLTRIIPPEIPSNWMAHARFDHKTHRVEPCDSCHHAEINREASVVDLPGVQGCRRCHGDGRAPTTCATCHAYHPPDPASWR